MIGTNYQLEFCMGCGEPNPPEQEICNCGGRDFVYGNGFTYKNKEVTCDCGNVGFKEVIHINGNPIYTTNYKCLKCGNVISTQIYYESPYL